MLQNKHPRSMTLRELSHELTELQHLFDLMDFYTGEPMGVMGHAVPGEEFKLKRKFDLTMELRRRRIEMN